MIEDIKNIRSTKKDIKNFGITIGLMLFVIAVFLFLNNKDSFKIFFYISGFFFLTGLATPSSIKPIYLIWMAFSLILGWIMTRVVLSILFFLIITPIGFIAKIFRKDFLDMRRGNQHSYWNPRIRESEVNQNYEKQF